MKYFANIAVAVIFALLSRTGEAQQSATPAAPLDSVRLSGIVQDSASQPISDVEIALSNAPTAAHTDARGRFTIAAPPGNHEMIFRKVGWQSVRYTWVAQANGDSEIVIVLRTLPHTLDPVVIRERENAIFKGTASLSGSVIDSAGVPIEDAEVQVVGAHATGVTRTNGGFLFRSLPAGPLIVRVRKLGYSPNVLSIQLVPNDDREVVIRLHALPHTLDAVVVNERSGYGASQRAWEEFETRRRFRTSDSFVLGPEDLKRYYSMPLDMASKIIFGGADVFRQRYEDLKPPPQIPQGVKAPVAKQLDARQDDVCILINGSRPERLPLRIYGADEIEMLEIYPGGSDLSGTVAVHMESIPDCRALSRFAHPTYYVIWLRGRS